VERKGRRMGIKKNGWMRCYIGGKKSYPGWTTGIVCPEGPH